MSGTVKTPIIIMKCQGIPQINTSSSIHHQAVVILPVASYECEIHMIYTLQFFYVGQNAATVTVTVMYSYIVFLFLDT